MSRVHRPYMEWEDWAAGMWNGSDDFLADVARAVHILGSPEIFRTAAAAMVADWSNAASHNLTDTGQNRRSWVGQATCCHLAGIPESATRAAWWELTEAEREAANAVADEVIAGWLDENPEGGQRCLSFD